MCVHPSAPPGFDFSIYMAFHYDVLKIEVDSIILGTL